MWDMKRRTRHNSTISTPHTTKHLTQIMLANPKALSHRVLMGHLLSPMRNIALSRTTTRTERARAILRTALEGILFKSKAQRCWMLANLKWITNYFEIVAAIQDFTTSRHKLTSMSVEKRMLHLFRQRHQETLTWWGIRRKISIASGRWLYQTLTNRQYFMRINSMGTYSSILEHHSTKEVV